MIALAAVVIFIFCLVLAMPWLMAAWFKYCDWVAKRTGQ